MRRQEVADQFVDYGQQKLAAETGLWVFLGSETLFFGSLFLALAVYRWLYPSAFTEGTHRLDFLLGTLNTGVLLTSSWTMAMAVKRSAEEKPSTRWLAATALLGALFLAIKAAEYHKEWKEHLIPAWNFDLHQFSSAHALLFFLLYFLMTGLHALHLLIGMGAVSWLGFRNSREEHARLRASRTEIVALYWHFVDLVWVFLYPCLYLIGRS